MAGSLPPVPWTDHQSCEMREVLLPSLQVDYTRLVNPPTSHLLGLSTSHRPLHCRRVFTCSRSQKAAISMRFSATSRDLDAHARVLYPIKGPVVEQLIRQATATSPGFFGTFAWQVASPKPANQLVFRTTLLLLPSGGPHGRAIPSSY